MIVKNMNTLDRIARMLLGIVCIWAGFWNSDAIGNDTLSIVVGVFAVVNIGSAILAHCPIYLMAGLSSIRTSPNDANG